MTEPDSKLLQLVDSLSDGELRSGESLGELCGISRAGVWKQLQKLAGLGIPIESIRGAGYRIPGGLDLLSRPLIESLCRQHSGNAKVCLHPVVDSTNKIAMKRLLEAGETGVFHLAEAQTAGRGRRGRPWVSPYGTNIYLSVAWAFEEGVAALMGLSLAAGVVIRGCLQNWGAERVRLKWPNDLVADQRKLGGILIEVVGDPSDSCRVVLGVGLNVRTPSAAAVSIDQPWANLAEYTSCPVGRNELATSLIVALSDMLHSYGPGAFAKYRHAWQAADAFTGWAVTLTTPSQQFEGVARGVDHTGALLLEREGGLEAFSGGEVSLRARST